MDEFLKILILEENRDSAERIIDLLKKKNFRFESKLVLNKRSFVKALDQFEPDLILCTHSLPHFSITDAQKIIQKHLVYIPFIIVTGTLSEELVSSNIYRLGEDNFILRDSLIRLPIIVNSASQKKEADTLIKLKEEQIRFTTKLLSVVGQAIIATDLDDRIIYWNKAAEGMYGWSEQEALGSHIIDILLSPDSKKNVIAIIKHVKEGQVWKGDFFVQKKDGSTFPAFVTNSPLYDNNGKLTGIVSVSNDVSEQKKTHEELRVLEKQIMESQIQQQKMFTRAIIKAQEEERNYIGLELHDNINQILAGARLYLGVVAQKNPDFKTSLKYPMDLIENSIKEIRILSAKYVSPVKNIKLERLIKSLIEQLKQVTTIKTKFRYSIETKLNDELKLNIYRIIQEGINNITKHSSASNVTISVEETDNLIHINVMDDGKGFDLSAKRKGIGISNIINRTESFNGKFNIESSFSKGCRIQIWMPV